MEINYTRKHNESYMVVTDELESYRHEEKMIHANNVEALLDMNKVEIDGTVQYHYNISRKENLEDFFEARDFTLELLRRVIVNIQLAYTEIDKYLIDERHVFLSKETVFFEKTNDSFRVGLCYLPKDSGTVQEQFRMIMEYIISIVPSTDKKLTETVYNAYDLCLKDDYTLAEILDSLADEESEIYVEKIDLTELIEEEIPVVTEKYDEPQGEFLADDFDIYSSEKQSFMGQIKDLMQAVFTKKAKKSLEQPQTMREDFFVDPDYEIEERTVLLTDAKPSGKLIYDGPENEDDFLINKDIFRIGSSSKNDAVLRAKTVSGNHAKIVKENGDYYISDLNSTNLTYLNDEPLTYRRPVKLSVADKIAFANVCYTFM